MKRSEPEQPSLLLVRPKCDQKNKEKSKIVVSKLMAKTGCGVGPLDQSSLIRMHSDHHHAVSDFVNREARGIP